MRHRIHYKKLNRTSEHRRALCRNMAQSVIEHGQVTTTLPKAKNIRPYVEKLVSLAVQVRKRSSSGDKAGALRARRRIYQLLGDRSIVPAEHRQTYNDMTDAQRKRTLRMASGRRHRTGDPKGRLAFTGETVIHRLIEKLAPSYEDRPGGYARIIRLAQRRVGDHTALAVVQLVGNEDPPMSLTKPKKSARQLRTDARYAMVAKLAKGFKAKAASKAKPESSEEPAE